MIQKISLVLLFLIIVFPAHSAECVGLKRCIIEYSLITNTEVEFEKAVNFDTVSVGVETASFTKDNAREEFKDYMSLNLFNLDYYKDGKVQITNLRKGIFITSPIFIVTPGNIPPVFSGEGPVTLVYRTNKDFKDIRGWRLNFKLNSNNLIEIENKKIVAISDTYENASAIMNLIFSNDK